MKNKLCYILLGILLNFSFINVVFADEYQVNVLATPSATEVLEGEEVTVILSIKSDSLVDTCVFETTFDSTLEFVDMNIDATSGGWMLNKGSANSFAVENVTNSTASLSNGLNIVQMKYKINGDGALAIKAVNCSYAGSANKEDQVEDVEIETVTINFKAKTLSEVTTLDSLVVNKGGTMSEPFVSSKNGTYFIELSSLAFGLEWKTTNPDYQNNVKVINYDTKEEINDPNNITFESNGATGMPIQVVVSDNNGNSTTYTLVAIMSQQIEYNNTLKSITINGQQIELVNGKFKNGTYEYEYTVENNVSSVKIEAELNDSENFKFNTDKGNAPGNFTINDVINAEIVIEPKSSEIEAIALSYKIQITKKESATTKPEEDKTPSGGNTGNNNGGNSNGGSSNETSKNPTYNPNTGGVSMYIMAVILIVSLVGSIVLYQKNLNAYK